MTMVVMLPSLRVIRGPYVLESLERARWGWSPMSSKMFPMTGKGLGPGGSLGEPDFEGLMPEAST
jgi:hypothetical protein